MNEIKSGNGASQTGYTSGFSEDSTYDDLKNKVQDFFNTYLCNKESGLFPTTCGGATMVAGGGKTLLDVASGMFGIIYGFAKIGYGLGIELPCNAINHLTGGNLKGIGSLIGLGASGAGGLFTGAMWLATRPWHAVDTLIGAVVTTISVLHKTSFIGGENPLVGPISSSIPRISPLHLILGTVLFLSLTGSSSKTNRPTLVDECLRARAQAQIEKLNNKNNKKVFLRNLFSVF